MFLQQPEADRLVQAATAALTAGRVEHAAALLDQALTADPNHLMALTKQAELALLRRDHGLALALTATVLAIEPNFAPAWHQRASALWLAGQTADALRAARRAVDIQPPNPDFRLRLARFAAWTAHGNEVAGMLQPLLAAQRHDPTRYAEAVAMLGEQAIAEGRFDEASTHLDRALVLQPKLIVIRMLRGMNQLRRGQFREGWADYASREAILGLYPDGQPKLADHAWQGQDLSGKTLLVTDDQGHGDAIQFFRYLPLLRDRSAAHITWRTFSPLVRLLAAAAPYATVVDALPETVASPGRGFDFHCNSTSLPRWFETELATIPASPAYLRAPRQPPRRRASGLNVGLAWSGDSRHARDHLRSIPALRFLTLADVPGLAFHSLQHAVRPTDLPALEARPGIVRAVEAATDFADTAALIARLDLVVTVDTAVAHLAAALGKPVWLVLHVAPDWRWLAERSDSPWYPTMRLFRVAPAEWLEASDGPAGADWAPILARVQAALCVLASGD